MPGLDMRKLLSAFCLFLCSAFLTVQTAQAAGNLGAANAFNSIGGTTTFDRGGSVHSQARSIYSLGGGMTSFQGKRVSLLAADPPSFSAGCNGISWHFGGFAFISLDEIRQLVEAVAQASLGIAVDLAMQTLCPQCYAVMSKLREMSNMMRNAAADSCRIAQDIGNMMKEQGIFTPTQRTSSCSKDAAGKGTASSWMDAVAGQACKLLGDAETKLTTAANDFKSWLKDGTTADGKTPDKELLETTGNMTFKALTALGYENGVVKDLLLSLLGMSVVNPKPEADCKATFAQLYGSAGEMQTRSDVSAADKAVLSNVIATSDAKVVKARVATDDVRPADAAASATPATPTPGGTVKSLNLCTAPPVLTGMLEVGKVLMCGYNVGNEMMLFARNNIPGSDDSEKFAKLQKTSLGTMCDQVANVDKENPLVYTCRQSEADCMDPKMSRLSELIQSNSVNGYTGLAWMVGDALYSGVKAVRDNNRLPDKTKRILNGSGWPLYRLINMAAVYPALAEELLNAYASAIAAQYALDSLDKVAAVGAQPSISMRATSGITPQSITAIREHIMDLSRAGNTAKTQVLERLAEKRKLVEVIMQVNKTLQAEVISQGLAGNTNLAVTLKLQSRDAAAAAARAASGAK